MHSLQRSTYSTQSNMGAAGSYDPVTPSLLSLFLLAKYLYPCWVRIPSLNKYMLCSRG